MRGKAFQTLPFVILYKQTVLLIGGNLHGGPEDFYCGR